ncbi:MAG: hypothetical protein B6A08_09310 [Sorangiineae bacterium NIC37A_2]|nr:MAG: hypothetical protein B6A08_09310 [Sorangiineae bacterium NIC37A_2]
MQIAFVLFVLFGSVALFVSDRYRMDLVGFSALTLLLLGGVLTVPEALAGFSDPSVHMIGGLFIVGAAVFETGLAERFGNLIERFGGESQTRLLLSILVATSCLSAFLSSTGTVALMVPVVLTLARRAQVSPSKLLIPLAYATLLGGLLTLIATAPNLVVSAALQSAGYRPFSFFDFTGPGLILVAAGIAFLVTLGPKLLPDRAPLGENVDRMPSARELWQRYGLAGWILEVRVEPDSPLIGKSIRDSAVRSRFGVVIMAVRSPDEEEVNPERPLPERILGPGDILTIKGAPSSMAAFCGETHLTEIAEPESLPKGTVVAELLIPPGSHLVGKTIRDSRLRSRFGVTIVAVFRTREVLRDSVALTTTQVGDLLLALGSATSLAQLRDELSDVLVVTESEALNKGRFRRHRAPHALVVVLAMLLGFAFEWTAPVTVVLAAALGMLVFGCLDAKSAERSVNWESLLLIATFLPMTTALTKVGVIDLVVSGIATVTGGAGPYVVMAALFWLTVLCGVFISNTATAVLVAPIAIQVAGNLHIEPHPLLMAVAIACSSAFLTPVSSPVNLLVANPGSYRFGDFGRIGAPLLLVVFAITLLIVPLFFPF